jgi:hypothetical protein
MTAIKIDTFGGLSPSVDPRNLSGDGAQVARNLDMRFGDFRPSRGLGPSLTTVAAGTQSIFRTPSGVWLSSTNDVNYVNGQINDAASERVYLTGNAAYPEAWQSGVYRRLGVPKPAEAPQVTVIVQDEFDQNDADAAQEAALTATVNALTAIDSQVWLGNTVPTGGGGAVDPLYPKVQLHMQFNALSGGHFIDSSPQKRTLTNSGSVALTTATTGPLGTGGGAGFGEFSGGYVAIPYIDRKSFEADPTWTVDATVKPTQDLEYVVLFARNGGLREITFQRAGMPDSVGNYRTLVSSDFGGGFTALVRCKRTSGANFCAAGESAHVSVQNTGSGLQVYIDGELCGSFPVGQHLEIHNVGRSSWTGTQAFLGSIDELRVTFAARYTANFTKPTTEYGTLVVAPGQFVAHGDVSATSLPTTDAGDAAYIVPMTLVGGSFQITNAGDAYLSNPSLNGVQITYSGSPYWAVPLPNWRGSGLTTTQSAIATALDAVQSPPGTDLLTTPQATALAAPLFTLYNPSAGDLLQLVVALNSAQAELRAQLAATGDATAVATKAAAVSNAAQAIETYFSGIESEIRLVLAENESTLYGSITSQIVNRIVETRAYVVTYLTDWGEESQPSLPSELLTLDQNDNVQITVPAPPSGRNIVGYRIYRSSTTNTGAAFQLIDAKAAVNASLLEGAFNYLDFSNRVYLDTAKQEELQEECPSLIWAEPPAGLKGLVGLPNGIMAGFFGKTLCFSVPYKPFAWPVEYQQTVEFNIVGIGVFGQTAVVLTEGFPYYASGADSASMSVQKIENPQACMAKRTIASSEMGVIFASPDGLCVAGPSGVQVLTTGAFSKDDWQDAVTSAAFGAYSDGSYYLFTGEE